MLNDVPECSAEAVEDFVKYGLGQKLAIASSLSHDSILTMIHLDVDFVFGLGGVIV